MQSSRRKRRGRAWGGRQWIAIIGATLIFVFGIVPVLYTFIPPGPMAYCEALKQRKLVLFCADDPSPPPGGKSVTFKVNSSGLTGRVMIMRDTAAYWAIQGAWQSDKKKRRIYVWGTFEKRLLIYVPSPLDAVDTDDFSHFNSDDVDQIARHETLKWWPDREHPVHSDACRREPACMEEGKCAIYPRKPNQCMAGFDEDCFASKACATSGRCAAEVDYEPCALGDAPQR